jgi:hypothetical protein
MESSAIEHEFPYRHNALVLVLLVVVCLAAMIFLFMVMSRDDPRGWLFLAACAAGFVVSCWMLWVRLGKQGQRIAFGRHGVFLPRNRFTRREEFVAYQDIQDLCVWRSHGVGVKVTFSSPKGRYTIFRQKTGGNDLEKIWNLLLHTTQQAQACPPAGVGPKLPDEPPVDSAVYRIDDSRYARILCLWFCCGLAALLAGAATVTLTLYPALMDNVPFKNVRLFRDPLMGDIYRMVFGLFGSFLFVIGVSLLCRAWVGLKLRHVQVFVSDKGLCLPHGDSNETIAWKDIDFYLDCRPYTLLGGSGCFLLIQLREGRQVGFPEGLDKRELLRETVIGEVTNRQLPTKRAALDQGEPVTFGAFTLDRNGLTYGRSCLLWEEVDVMSFEESKFVVRKKGKPMAWCKVTTIKIPNLALFVKLLNHELGQEKVPWPG